MMAEAVVGQWQWQLLLGTGLFVAVSMSHSCHLSPFVVLVDVFCSCCLQSKFSYELSSDSRMGGHRNLIWARPSVFAPLHILMSNLQASILTYIIDTQMYMITGIYSVVVRHISIYIYIVYKYLQLFTLYMWFKQTYVHLYSLYIATI